MTIFSYIQLGTVFSVLTFTGLNEAVETGHTIAVGGQGDGGPTQPPWAGVDPSEFNCDKLQDSTLLALDRLLLQTQCDIAEYGKAQVLEYGRCTVRGMIMCYKDILQHFNLTSILIAGRYFNVNPMSKSLNITKKCEELAGLNPNDALICALRAKQDCPPHSAIPNILTRSDLTKLTNFQVDFCYNCPDAVSKKNKLKDLAKDFKALEKHIYLQSLKYKNYTGISDCVSLHRKIFDAKALGEDCSGLLPFINSTVNSVLNSFKIKPICGNLSLEEQINDIIHMDNITHQDGSDSRQEEEIGTLGQNKTEVNENNVPNNKKVNINDSKGVAVRGNSNQGPHRETTPRQTSSGSKLIFSTWICILIGGLDVFLVNKVSE